MDTEADIIENADWNELWKKALVAASWRKKEKDPVRFFDQKAEWYNRTVMGRSGHIRETLARLAIDDGCSVLDIGSGPGTLAIPLAKTAGKITAVEPSKDMLHFLEENAGKENITNITSIHKRWEDVELGKDLESHDIVIASHSLAMMDIKEALFKINRAARRRVYLFAFAGKPQWDYLELWPKLYGEAFVSSPGYIFIVNILYQMGITANVEIWEQYSKKQISDLEEGVKERMAYYDSPLPDAEKIIREHLEAKRSEGKGELWTERRSKTAMI